MLPALPRRRHGNLAARWSPGRGLRPAVRRAGASVRHRSASAARWLGPVGNVFMPAKRRSARSGLKSFEKILSIRFALPYLVAVSLWASFCSVPIRALAQLRDRRRADEEG